MRELAARRRRGPDALSRCCVSRADPRRPRLALVGLAKNTGKTVALAALLGELERPGRTVGVTSVGRDGEEHDVIDFRIEKPRVRAGGRAASWRPPTSCCARAGCPTSCSSATDVRTPLGRVLIARLQRARRGRGRRAERRRRRCARWASAMLAPRRRAGADRRRDRPPRGLLAGGRRRARDVHRRGPQQRASRRSSRARAEAVELVRLPLLGQRRPAGEPRAGAGRGPRRCTSSGIVGEDGERARSCRRASRCGPTARRSAELLREHAAGELSAGRRGAARALAGGAAWRCAGAGASSRRCVVARPHARVRRQPRRRLVPPPGHRSCARPRSAPLLALTVNPVAPQSHSFDSQRLRDGLSRVLEDVPIVDVCAPEY